MLFLWSNYNFKISDIFIHWIFIFGHLNEMSEDTMSTTDRYSCPLEVQCAIMPEFAKYGIV
jgi:hypothetical protein